MYYTRPSDGRTYCFIPVPLLAESQEILRTGGGDERLGVITQLTFNGTLLPTMPALSGVPDESTCISLLDRKRDQLKDALSEDRGNLLIVDISGYPIVAVQPLVTALSFDEERLVFQSPYSVTFEYETPVGTGYVREYTESWDFSQQENDTVAVSHQISAVGIPQFSPSRTAIQNARLWVLPRIGGPDVAESLALRNPFVAALVDITSLSSYNHIIQETSDVTAGSYSVNETWVMSSGAFLDDRTIEITHELDDSNTLVQSININGTVQGYGDTTFDRYTNAQNGFDTFVAPQINFNAASGISAKSRSLNRIAGTVTYSVSLVPSGSTEQLTNRSISRSFERQDDGSVVQTVTTSCALRPGSSGNIADAIAFCFSENYPISSAEPIFSASLSGNLLSVSTQRDELARSFSLTKVFTDQTTPLWTEQFNIDRTQGVETAATQITIQGTIQGLGVETSTKSMVRFANASGAYFNTVEPLIVGRISQIIPADTCVYTAEPTTKTFGINQLAGTISYSQTFESRLKNSNGAIKSERVAVTFQRAGRVIAEIPIPGKLSGPILQDQETYTGLSKQLSISYVMLNEGPCGNTNAGSNEALEIALAESDTLVENTSSQNARGEKPTAAAFKTEDTVTFDRTTWEFGRNVTWKYV